MDTKNYQIHFAPLQGYTDSIYRNAYEAYFGGIAAYYTPFVRVERNTFRTRDLRDIDPANDTTGKLIPQILPGSVDEMRALADLLKEKGYARADINMGCPFPLIARQKKGAGMLPYPEQMGEILSIIKEVPEIAFSLKMRLGMEEPEECMRLLPMLNELPLGYITMHARVGKQQYKGETQLDAFARFYEECTHPLLYNGDLMSVEDIHRILERFEKLSGVMIGRGILSSPFLVKEFQECAPESDSERMETIKKFHRTLLEGNTARLQDELQLVTKMKTVWDYLLPDTEHRLLKKIKKSRKLSDYSDAVVNVFNSYR